MDSLEIYRIIAENTLDTIVLVDNHAIVQFVSPSIEMALGYTVAEYLGMDAFDIIHPEDRDRVRFLHAEAVRTKLSVDLEYRLLHADGQTIYVETRVKPVLDENGIMKYVVAVVRDISKRKEMEKALEESEQRYKSLFENNLDGVFSIDLNLYFVNANQAFETITGIDIHKMNDRCFMGLVFDEDHFTVNAALYEVIQLKEPRDIECRIIKSKHGEKIVSITLVPIMLNGQLTGVHGIVKDITQRKKDEQELIRSEERYKLLQQSINRFTNDLANVMKVSDLEKRLVDEVTGVLRGSTATIVEFPLLAESVRNSPTEKWLKIGQKDHPVYLHLELKQPILRIEEEWLETAVHYATILHDNLQLIEDLMKKLEAMVASNETPKWMLRLLFKLSEKERFALSSDLHDSVLQDLIIWYRRLEALRSLSHLPEETQTEIKKIEEGILDSIHQIRITCNELRPPFLLKMGLVESVKSLLSYTRMFANYEIEFNADQFECQLSEEQLLAMYRVVQELLNNASKHSEASKVTMTLSCDHEKINFSYSDDGVGIDLSFYESSFQHMGISGIEKRVYSLDGIMKMKSSPNNGFHVDIEIPKNN